MYKLPNRKYFHSTTSKKADPATTAVISATVNIASLDVTLMIVLGLCTCILGVWFLPPLETGIQQLPDVLETHPTGNNIPIGIQSTANGFTGVGIISLYLNILTNLHNTLEVSLNTFTVEQLQNMLFSLEGVIRLHEYTFENFTHYINVWEQFMGGTELYYELEDLYEQWREVGNLITEFYRQIERQLHIAPGNSSLAPQDYE